METAVGARKQAELQARPERAWCTHSGDGGFILHRVLQRVVAWRTCSNKAIRDDSEIVLRERDMEWSG